MAPSKRDQKNRMYYLGLFALFGMVIAFFTALLTYRLDALSMEKELKVRAEEVFDQKMDDFETFTSGLESITGSLRDNTHLYRYLQDPTEINYDNLSISFLMLANSNPNLMQVRFIDKEGIESVRVDWPIGRERAALVPVSELQDKSNRYYFQEASQALPFSYWYSRLDLNIEHGKIEIPERPVLRVASPVYMQRKFRGIVIINVHMKEFLNKLAKNSIFDICLIDGKGYYMVSHDPEYSWSRYRESGYSVETAHPEYAHEILRIPKNGAIIQINNLFVGSLGNLLPKDNSMLMMHADESTVQSLEQERQKAAVFIIAVIAALSAPLALLISRGPSKLYKKISEQNRQLSESIELIDKNIHIGTIDLQRNFREASSALATTLGMGKDALIGMKYDSLYCSTRPKEYYDTLWNALAKDGHWSGELQHARQDGECYWADTLVLPKHNDDGSLVGYSVIYQDITDKKRIEQLSITDELTGLYNRRFFNVVIQKELGRAKRDGNDIVFAMLDIDYFKQYNDNYGHQKGDEVLKEVSAIMKERLSRGGDYCFRLGGEEFGILYTKIDTAPTDQFIDSIRQAIERRGLAHGYHAGAEVVTISAGVLNIKATSDVSVDTIYRLADEALYAAKNAGRNRVVVQECALIEEESAG